MGGRRVPYSVVLVGWHVPYSVVPVGRRVPHNTAAPVSAAVALPASIILYLLLCNNKKIKEDYRLNKEIQRQEDEETERQLAILEARMRGGKAEDGMPVEPTKRE